MESRQLLINNTLVSYATVGMGEKALIFLHGWRSSKEAWLPIAQLVENSGYRLLFIDLPGFGASEIPKNPYTLHDYAETIRMFMEKLNLRHCVVIGHSFGARVGIKLATESPALIKKLVLVASGGANARLTNLTKITAKIIKPFFMPQFMHPLRKKIYHAIGADDYLATPQLQKTFLNIVNENSDPLLPHIKTETLIIWGDKDQTAPLEYGRRIARHIPNARLEIIKDAEHYCFRENPQKFVSLLTEFLNK